MVYLLKKSFSNYLSSKKCLSFSVILSTSTNNLQNGEFIKKAKARSHPYLSFRMDEQI